MTDVSSRIILDLCGGTGAWSAPYREAGYTVYVITLPDMDVRNFRDDVVKSRCYGPVHGVLAAPPCDHFAGSGARWWEGKDIDGRTLEGMEIAFACIAIIKMVKPTWWCIENPVGRFKRMVMNDKSPVWEFDPCDYGDPYTKRTQLWGEFNIPKLNRVEPTDGSKMHLVPPGPDQKEIRSVTPPGFARAFFEANP
jgi:hypothetical protein